MAYKDEYGRWVINPDVPDYMGQRYWQPTNEASAWATRAAPALPYNSDLAALYGTGQLSPEVQARMLANPYSGQVTGQNLGEGFNNWLSAMQSPTYGELSSKNDPVSQYFYQNPSQWGQYITRWGAPGGDQQPGGVFSYSPEAFYGALTGQPAGAQFLQEQSASAQSARHPGPNMGWLVPLGLAAGVMGLQGAGLWGGAGEAGAAGAGGGTGLTYGAGGQTGLTYGAGGAAGLSPSAAATGMGWGAGGVGASLPWAESLGRGLSFDAGGETGLTYGAGGETGLTAPQSWGSFPEWSSGTGEFSGGSLGTGLKPGGGTGFAPNGGTGLKIPGLNAPSTYTPGGWLEKGSKMLEDYFMPKGELSLSRLLNPVSSIASGFMQSRASKDAALEQVRAAQQALQMLGGQNAAGQAALAPYQQAGTAMLSDLTAGLSPGGRYTQGFSGVDFQNDPGYMSQLEEGMRAIQGSAAAKRLLKSGATAKALTKYGQELASRTYNDAYNRWRQQQTDDYNRRANLAGLGQTTANQLTSFGNQNAQTLASLLGSQASAAGAGTIGSANAWTGALSNLLGSASQQNILDALRRAGVI